MWERARGSDAIVLSCLRVDLLLIMFICHMLHSQKYNKSRQHYFTCESWPVACVTCALDKCILSGDSVCRSHNLPQDHTQYVNDNDNDNGLFSKTWFLMEYVRDYTIVQYYICNIYRQYICYNIHYIENILMSFNIECEIRR